MLEKTIHLAFEECKGIAVALLLACTAAGKDVPRPKKD
jgi:hypothetical protein